MISSFLLLSPFVLLPSAASHSPPHTSNRLVTEWPYDCTTHVFVSISTHLEGLQPVSSSILNDCHPSCDLKKLPTLSAACCHSLISSTHNTGAHTSIPSPPSENGL